MLFIIIMENSLFSPLSLSRLKGEGGKIYWLEPEGTHYPAFFFFFFLSFLLKG